MEDIEFDKFKTALTRDPVVSLMFGFSFFLMIFNVSAGFVLARTGTPGLLEDGLLMTAVFAVFGIVFGLKRSLRSGRANKGRIG